MKEYQQRVIEEKNILSEKIDKLSKFLESNVAETLAEHSLLKEQLAVMETYRSILNKRISSWGIPEVDHVQ